VLEEEPFSNGETQPVVSFATWTFGNFTCLKPTIEVARGFTIYDPALIPVIIAGMAVGWHSFSSMRKLTHLVGHSIYSKTFLFFGFMNFFALFADCLFKEGWMTHPNNWYEPFFAIADGVMSSFVNFSLILLGLVDLGLLKENSFFFRLITTGIYTAIIIAWYYVFHGWLQGFIFLYMQLAEYAFIIWPILSLLFLIKKRKEVFFGGLFWIAISVGAGLLGFATLTNGEWVCQHTTYWITTETWWFIESFVAVASVSAYFFATQAARIPDEMKNQQILPFTGDNSVIEPNYIPLQQIQLAPPGVVPPPMVVSQPQPGLYADNDAVYLPLQCSYTHVPQFPVKQ